MALLARPSPPSPSRSLSTRLSVSLLTPPSVTSISQPLTHHMIRPSPPTSHHHRANYSSQCSISSWTHVTDNTIAVTTTTHVATMFVNLSTSTHRPHPHPHLLIYPSSHSIITTHSTPMSLQTHHLPSHHHLLNHLSTIYQRSTATIVTRLITLLNNTAHLPTASTRAQNLKIENQINASHDRHLIDRT
ncbi:hypothetical protein TPHA_0L00100 [Tetrapisispora phaffii CBS 4417]|uniref:Uncharacterized protein n=1 Tax=Tetrapisispora phaffii (strain ATCC 24235 / CBS 4417 / NBRC 1672 / NRRL Y-8282 / UCD 70-5) TaxID=1071381 RepID=G8BZP2_TETPH|nr:hypothetical protein TPHA_0L00100 [Tetrapisispora phaffii CBS 4417]CCE65370.1 hypothetical protein TPHA_0L00100 [Tetrapisispora phaffii CBS 4417]